jgi:hypothetical protein
VEVKVEVKVEVEGEVEVENTRILEYMNYRVHE